MRIEDHSGDVEGTGLDRNLAAKRRRRRKKGEENAESRSKGRKELAAKRRKSRKKGEENAEGRPKGGEELAAKRRKKEIRNEKEPTVGNRVLEIAAGKQTVGRKSDSPKGSRGRIN